MTASRPIGERIRTICRILERTGPQGIADLRGHMPDVEPSNLWKYCNRSVGLGVVTVSRDSGRAVFSVVPGWEVIADKRRTTKQSAPPKIARPLPRTRWAGVSSVFQMGAQHG